MTDPKPQSPKEDSPKLQSSSWSRNKPSLANAFTPRPDYMLSRQEREAERIEWRRIWGVNQYFEAATHAAGLGIGQFAEHLRPPEQPGETGEKGNPAEEKTLGQSKGKVNEKGRRSSE
ncbi:hypothetical protein B0A48_01934 [Cryoendolithus antarcticus]|uniref:Uncharacterized protein n=1 Tax=Cryoendolithus antarcticus TaxID=1507870 RepID=A0A1V8TQV0_9PEZI|nr:hypothetical protein B0A48_01934 [Cryoendolithus antarcticus]